MVAAIFALALLFASPVPAGRAEAIKAMNDGVDLVARGQLGDADEKLREAVVIDPTYELAHFNLGILHQRQGKLADARASFRDALDHSSGETSVEMRYRLGLVVLEMSEAEGLSRQDRAAGIEEALGHFQAVAKAEPERARAHLRAAWCLERLDRPTEADRSYRRAIEHDPRLAAAYTGLGNMYIAYGHANVGMAVLEVGTKVNDTDAEAWMGLGNGLSQLEKPAEAVEAYRKVKTIDPDRIEAVFRLGMSYADLRERKEAVENLRAFLMRADNDVPEAWKRAANATIARMQDTL
jgi:tetratricopeptide (TPR) repeat protein